MTAVEDLSTAEVLVRFRRVVNKFQSTYWDDLDAELLSEMRVGLETALDRLEAAEQRAREAEKANAAFRVGLQAAMESSLSTGGVTPVRRMVIERILNDPDAGSDFVPRSVLVAAEARIKRLRELYGLTDVAHDAADCEANDGEKCHYHGMEEICEQHGDFKEE